MTEAVELKDYLTLANPLGPHRHDGIIKSPGGSVSTLLLYQVELFDQVLKNPTPLIVGRRGAGKTAIVRWRRKIGQAAKVGSTSLKDGLYDWETEAVLG